MTADRFEGVAAPTPGPRGSAPAEPVGPRRARVLYRVAAGPRLGFGHLLRMRALADAMGGTARASVRGGRCALATARALGFGVAQAGDPFAGVDVVVIDDPRGAQQARWVRRARKAGLPVVVVQDTPGVAADLVVRPSASVRQPSDTAPVLAGPRFALLDPRLPAHVARARARSGRLVVALGGGAHVRQVAQLLVDALRQRLPEADIRVAGGFAARLPPLSRARWIAPGRRAFLAALATCDVAIVAGGVTILEACVAGAPCVALAVVPAQRPAIRALSRAGAVVDARGLASTRAGRGRAAGAAARLIGNEAMSRRLARRARTIVDGRGAQRVALAIRALVAQGRHRD